MSIEFFVSTDSEVEAIDNIGELFELTFQYNICASGANDLKTVMEISNFFLKCRDFVPNQVIKTISGSYSGGEVSLNIFNLIDNLLEASLKMPVKILIQ